ncbi:MAG: hypothetical protein L6R39_003559 [Caloplaca ligustica]|nr:MAG: hypothetical protein L6R39_003559 [Caloplaca ligustica]
MGRRKAFPSISQVLCTLPCCQRRGSEATPRPQPAVQGVALGSVLGAGYPPTDPAAERRKYEVNMHLLFRLYHQKTFHKLIPKAPDGRTRESYVRLVALVNTMPGAAEKRHKAGQIWRVGKEGYLTELAKYWRSLPDKKEMMEYKDIWEHVAQRPLAWEGLVDAKPLPAGSGNSPPPSPARRIRTL